MISMFLSLENTFEKSLVHEKRGCAHCLCHSPFKNFSVVGRLEFVGDVVHETFHFLFEFDGINHHPVANNAVRAGMQNTGWYQVKNKFIVIQH